MFEICSSLGVKSMEMIWIKFKIWYDRGFSFKEVIYRYEDNPNNKTERKNEIPNTKQVR
jgi:hypothetical protein